MVRLHTIEGGLQLKIGQGIMARSIYIYGDDEASEADDEQFYHDTEEDEDVVRGGMNSRAVVSGSVASEEGVACPVCLSTYSSNGTHLFTRGGHNVTLDLQIPHVIPSP
ncbi:hypothetical protein WJX79_006851 [Trebouxia sp. C0005]